MGSAGLGGGGQWGRGWSAGLVGGVHADEKKPALGGLRGLVCLGFAFAPSVYAFEVADCCSNRALDGLYRIAQFCAGASSVVYDEALRCLKRVKVPQVCGDVAHCASVGAGYGGKSFYFVGVRYHVSVLLCDAPSLARVWVTWQGSPLAA